MVLPSYSSINVARDGHNRITSKEIWESIKKKVVSMYGEIVFKSWFRTVEFSHYDSGTIFLTVSSRFICDWIKTNYLDFVLKSWREVDTRVVSIDIIVGEKNAVEKKLTTSDRVHSAKIEEIQKDSIIKNFDDIPTKNDFFSIIIDTKNNSNIDPNNKALAVRRNYSFDDIVGESFYENNNLENPNKKNRKAKSEKKEDGIRTSFFQQSLSLITDHEENTRVIEEQEPDLTHRSVVFHENNAIKSQVVERNLFFDSRYTFDNFVTDDSNELAFFAAKSLAKNERIGNFGNNYNPLFLYGGVGLGKTHLIHAIANYKIHIMRTQYPNDWEKRARERIVYSSSEKFMREFLSALRNRDTKNFKEKFRNVDILMIDDIQFLNGKGCTQEEFFHIFSSLMSSGKQLVISADRVPSALSGIEDRLRSRLSCGIIADIKKGDFNFRLNILRKKADLLNNDFQDDVLEFLAENINSSIRELEGALNKLVMMRSLNSRRMIDIPFVREKLADMITANVNRTQLGHGNSYSNVNNNGDINFYERVDNSKNNATKYNQRSIQNIKEVQSIASSIKTVKSYEDRRQSNGVLSEDKKVEINKNEDQDFILKIQEKVCEFYEISMSELMSRGRVKKIVLPKQVAMYLARKLTSESLVEIAKKFGGKDHTTIIHGCAKIEELIKIDKKLQSEIEGLIAALKN